MTERRSAHRPGVGAAEPRAARAGRL